ncbi:response regulator [Croceimicrobium hydrocarbonivorans]|uniref:Response regulator n=1 Tax=Croceimicrobium hydrocarbonivorans TaxID=2761580 RepID=A0A7H0VG81_9FLAO|nr:response regulator [Croceimicrobium hydrocarbonivorans]QNR24729.1 response regulator [Croceimicrobium hydrocarbonivorans]
MMATKNGVIAEEERIQLVNRSMSHFLEGKRVLLAGANEVDEMLLRYMVVESGGVLNVAKSIEEMRKTLSKSRYDLILMNSRLDNENAMGILQQLRKEGLVKSPVVAISSNDLVGRAIHNGFAYVLRRPLEKRKILAALSAIFQN